MKTNNKTMRNPIKKNNKFEKLGFSVLYLSVIAYMILAFFALTSCSSDDDNSPESNTVAISDTNFEQALIDLDIDANGLNGNILKMDAEAVTVLNVASKNISSLQGIEAFINLVSLTCDDNNLISLDVSANTELKLLSANNNQLSEINLQSNTKLNAINFNENQLTSLDVSNLTALIGLYCSFNAIEVLDLSNNNALASFYCEHNALTSLNLKNGNNTEIINFVARSNPNLYCVQVDDFVYSNTNWSTGIDGLTAFAEDCN